MCNELELETPDELAALRDQLKEAREILEYIETCDLQILENGYEAEDRAAAYLAKYPK